MRFDLTDEQRSIKQAIRDLCQTRCDLATVRRIVEGGDQGTALWSQLAAAGWTGLAVAEQFGGQGLGILELSLAVEELGYALAPGAFFGNAAAGLLVDGAGDGSQRERWLPGIASGERRAALGTVEADGSALVLDIEGAALVVVAGSGQASVLELGDGTAESVEAVDITRRLSRVGASAGIPLTGDVAAALDRVEVVLAAELVGVAQHAMELALEHARQRQQFGRPIGAYQAVAHRCADMLLAVESARSAVLGAAWTADHDPTSLPFAASVAKATAAEGAWKVAAASLQVHGGIGFTWEHDIHLFLRRATASAHLLGSSGAHLERIAALSGLGALAPA